jgi:hypothetical protein
MKAITRVPEVRPCWYWILVKGCLFWGVPCTAILTALWYYSGTYSIHEGVLSAAPMSMLAGGIYGLGQWGFTLLQAVKNRQLSKEENDGQ